MIRNLIGNLLNYKNINPSIKVLIVEDSHSDANLITMAIHHCGFSAVVAYDGKSALEMLNRYDYHLIILDYQLPDMNGSEILKILRSSNTRNAQKAVLVVSAQDSSEVILNSYGNGADYYLKKPFSINLLTNKINMMIHTTHQN